MSTRMNGKAAGLSGYLTSKQVCERAGITYRQLDYWVRSGYITPAVVIGEGYGGRRYWAKWQMAGVRGLKRTMARKVGR